MTPRFPEFKKLTLEDRDQYRQLVARYTPFSDISFTTLHIWWNLDDKLFFSVLNDSLVLNYSQPFDQTGAGLSLIGHHQIDESLHTIFNFLKSQRRQPRLVHVPDFVVDKIKDKSRLEISEEDDMHEYVMDATACAQLEGRELGRIRRKVNRFMRETEDNQVEVRPVDLGQTHESQSILAALDSWQKKFPKANDPDRTEMPALEASIKHHQTLDIHNLAVFIDGNLHGLALFHISHDKKYLILNHLKVDYSTPFIFDFLTNKVAAFAVEHDVPYLNMEMDLGIEGLRRHKMGLRPVKFFRKYTVSYKG